MATDRIIFAGFGGQGVMSMGQMLAYSGMIEHKNVTWCPSYGPEMRGGTANCSVVISDELIGSPIITNDATALIAMNAPSLTKFEDSLISGSTLIINSSLIETKAKRSDLNVYYIEANKIAAEVGNPKSANMVMLGALVSATNLVKLETIEEAFLKVFGERTRPTALLRSSLTACRAALILLKC